MGIRCANRVSAAFGHGGSIAGRARGSNYDVRGVVFPGDSRRLMDLRRTGNVEAIAGGAEPAQLSAKLSNTLSQSNQIFDTYSPVQLAAVREADKARIEGRRRMKLSNIVAAIEAEQNPATENKVVTFRLERRQLSRNGTPSAHC